MNNQAASEMNIPLHRLLFRVGKKRKFSRITMTAMAFSSLRVGEKYKLINYSDTYEFKVKEKLSENNFVLKDIHTLEEYELEDLVRYGKSDNFYLYELEEE